MVVVTHVLRRPSSEDLHIVDWQRDHVNACLPSYDIDASMVYHAVPDPPPSNTIRTNHAHIPHCLSIWSYNANTMPAYV